jgi:uncharacterized protein
MWRKQWQYDHYEFNSASRRFHAGYLPFLISIPMSTPSPCISFCQMDAPTGWCRGCYRTIEEIMRWGQGSEAEKQAVWQALPLRHAQAAFPEALLNQGLMKACELAACKQEAV